MVKFSRHSFPAFSHWFEEKIERNEQSNTNGNLIHRKSLGLTFAQYLSDGHVFVEDLYRRGGGGRGVYFWMKLCVSKAYGGLFTPIQFFVKTRGGLTKVIKYRSAASARKNKWLL